jgi:phosphoglycerate dehydrogenase-like enzyme
MLPAKDQLIICIAHPAYQVKTCLDAAQPGFNAFEVRTPAEFERRIPEADVVLVSGMWRNSLLEHAAKLRLIQSISAGVNQYDQAALAERGVRLASAQGANSRAVAQHAMALILALVRRLHEARDNQAKKLWRPMQGDFALREDELTGKTLLIIGLGGIGGRLARLAKAFEMTVIGVRQDPSRGLDGADSVHALADLPSLLPQADFVALTCPLTPQTQGLIDSRALGLMKPTAYLVNVARGGCVVETDLIEALNARRIEGAALDTTMTEPLPADSPLWTMPHVFITSHLGGETRSYERNVVEILLENLTRLWNGETQLRNQIV